jgi:DNA-binding transcriptional regulator YhcF (GntR family)
MLRSQASAVTDSDRPDTLGIDLDRGSDQSLSRQISDQVWRDVISGVLETGSRLPTARAVAVGLGVAPNTVERAYAELARLGVVSVRQSGAFVSLSVSEGQTREAADKLEQACRTAVAEAEALGFSIDDLMDALAELRAVRRGASENQ